MRLQQDTKHCKQHFYLPKHEFGVMLFFYNRWPQKHAKHQHKFAPHICHAYYRCHQLQLERKKPQQQQNGEQQTVFVTPDFGI